MTASGGAGGLGSTQTVDVARAQAAAATQDAQEVIGSQEASEASMLKGCEDLINPAAATRIKKKEEKFESLEARRKPTADKAEKKSESTEEKGDTPLEDRFTEDLSEVSGEDFRGLKNSFDDDSSPDEILDALTSKFSDPTIKDLALDYLIQTAPSDGKLKSALIQAKHQLMSQNPQAIVGGRNVLLASETFASRANTSPSSLRSLYFQVTSSPSNCANLHQMLASYLPSEKTAVMEFLVNGMVADLKSEGPSIPPAKLQVYMTELSNLQALHSVNSFFDRNIGNLENSLKHEGHAPIPSLTTGNLTKTFLQLVEDKFPSSSKAQKALNELVGPDTGPQTEVLNLFFRALNGCSPRIFSGAEKKQQLASVITNTLDAINADNEDYPKPGDFPRSSFSSTPPHAPVPQSEIPTSPTSTQPPPP
ncbi:SctW family type III secretion system gatekeeper subunit CopN [Chlamydia trachomatis]|uniref:SctW family type III secretion system gatekeeper subunit CopN n=1 Tax=Chlamydia trachomatis TaxID=813 RepID=UPI0000F5321B|nr:SctW family type III secretion system gatekeeper subunit CopN [Chlamydia trachomatis]AGS01885.1 low calcium response E [Chlamydia trachomatis J/6276tet1]AGT70569.1 low calcium response E [Chlamydia trachomatis]AGT72411.1 low calcium response E [Chlamydia trachomatis]ATW09887.1 copN protein [Chlamydia trachomatis]ATW10794.1 copN protein [Chlamydia trachomatis]